jgi:hypothetical protein
MLCAGKSKAVIVEELRNSFGADKGRIEHDLELLIASLEQRQWIDPAILEATSGGLRDPAVGAMNGPAVESDYRASDKSETECQPDMCFLIREELLWTVKAFVTLVYVDFLVSISFTRLYRLLRRTRIQGLNRPRSAPSLILRSALRAERAYFKRVWCLQRSAALALLLRHGGWACNIVLGVRTFPFEAHAWVELGRRMVNDNPDYVRQFLVIDRF